jgi:hypothetical protein
LRKDAETMKSEPDRFTAQPYPRSRLLMVDGGQMGLKKHMIHGLVEFDITRAREKIRQYRVQTGEPLSFSTFFLACLGKAIDQDRQMHAYRNWRNQLILFDEVDGKKTIRPHILRGVNHKGMRELQEEIRGFQTDHASSQESKFIDWLCSCPGLSGAHSSGCFLSIRS